MAFALLLSASGGFAACSSPEVEPTSAVVNTVTLAVEGMTCGDCEQAIQAAVSKLPGVARCTASHVEKSAVVALVSDATTSPEDVAETIRKLGYTVSFAPPVPSQPDPAR